MSFSQQEKAVHTFIAGDERRLSEELSPQRVSKAPIVRQLTDDLPSLDELQARMRVRPFKKAVQNKPKPCKHNEH